MASSHDSVCRTLISLIPSYPPYITIFRLRSRYWFHLQQISTEDLDLRCTLCLSNKEKSRLNF
ncbi:hypothetical protein PNI0446_01989 [Streptococcus pneumoniae PNI0446]|nr:hypothetical protein PNI0446_01989 [Streptococcus pneumoniae PNI0446]